MEIGLGGGMVPRPRCSNDFLLCPIGHLTLALVPDHVEPWPLASLQGICGVTAQL